MKIFHIMMKSSIYILSIYIIMNIFPCLLAQENANLKEWKEIECTIPDAMKFDSIWGMEFEREQFILDSESKLYQFVASDVAEIKESGISDIQIQPKYRGYFYATNNLCGPQDSTHFWCTSQLHRKKRGQIYNYQNGSIQWENGQCFLMNGTHCFFDYKGKNLYKLSFLSDSSGDPLFNFYSPYSLDNSSNAPINILSIVVLGDKIYYLSESGLCVAILQEGKKDGRLKTELLTEVTTTGENILVTDKDNKIWIINSSNGVMEYDISNKTTTKIAEFPPVTINIGREIAFDKVFFSANNNLYCITDKKVYTLKDSSNPGPGPGPNPDKLHDQSGKTCGFLGFELIFIVAGISLVHLCRKR